MNVSIAGLPGLSGAGDAAMRAAVTVAALLLGACGGSSSTGASGPDPLATCDPGVPGAVAECGSVIVSFTDADGDFLNYTVDVLSLTLQTANGRVVETLPRETRINFTDYVDLTELVTVATVPPMPLTRMPPTERSSASRHWPATPMPPTRSPTAWTTTPADASPSTPRPAW